MPPAYEILLLNTAVPQIQAAQSGDTYVVPRDIAFSAALTLSAGTANGVPYLNGSKVLTTGSALTFDGTTLSVVGVSRSTTITGNIIEMTRAGTNYLISSNAASSWEFRGPSYAWMSEDGVTQRMALTSTGLGIGTSSPLAKLVVSNSGSEGIELGYSAGLASNFIQSINRVGGAGVDLSYFLIGTAVHKFYTDGAERMRLDTSGNLGLGVTPSAWAAYKALQVASTGGALSSSSSSDLEITTNAYYNAGWLSQGAGVASSRYRLNAGAHSWYTAPSGTAGNAITFTQALTLDANQNLLLNGTTAGASAVGTLAIFNGTAPTGSVTNGIILYAEDVSSSSELKVRDEAGNVTTLSPHNFSLIPEGPSEDMAWAYYSEKGGKRINVDMLKLARMVEQLTGEKLVYEA